MMLGVVIIFIIITLLANYTSEYDLIATETQHSIVKSGEMDNPYTKSIHSLSHNLQKLA